MVQYIVHGVHTKIYNLIIKTPFPFFQWGGSTRPRDWNRNFKQEVPVVSSGWDVECQNRVGMWTSKEGSHSMVLTIYTDNIGLWLYSICIWNHVRKLKGVENCRNDKGMKMRTTSKKSQCYLTSTDDNEGYHNYKRKSFSSFSMLNH